MTKQILWSAVALLAILVCISSAFESKDESLMANELASREARAAEHQDGGKKDAGKKRQVKRRRNKKTTKKSQNRKGKSMKGKNKQSHVKRNKKNAQGKKKKDQVKRNKKTSQNKRKERRKNQKKGKAKEFNKKFKKQNERNDGNIIVCPVCPQSAKTLCRSNNGRKMNKISRKEKKLLKKIKRTDRKIAKINKQIQNSRNGQSSEDDKLCETCCPPAPTPAPPAPAPAPAPATTPTPAPSPTTTGPTVGPVAADCLKESTTVMEVWRVQVTNFGKQCKRVDKQTGVAASKTNKSASFTDLSNLLATLNCPNNMAEIDNLNSTLANCSTKVTAACQLTSVDQTFVEECKTKTGAFVNAAEICKNAAINRQTDQCDCWKNVYGDVADVKQCKIAQTATIAEEFKLCKKAFSDCKKAEDEVGPAVISCGSPTATTTGSTRFRRKWKFDKLN